jgi:hypothetical protein
LQLLRRFRTEALAGEKSVELFGIFFEQSRPMKIRVAHRKGSHAPKYGDGVVKAISEHTADIRFNDALRTSIRRRVRLNPRKPKRQLAV